jgi:hypothetical protein
VSDVSCAPNTTAKKPRFSDARQDPPAGRDALYLVTQRVLLQPYA